MTDNTNNTGADVSNENNKRKREDEQEEEEEKERGPHFVHIKYLTKEMLKACTRWSEVMPIEGKCDVCYWNFDWDEFRNLTGADAPEIDEIKQRLYSISCWLQTPFGYSPYKDPKNPNGQIQNNLRVTLRNWIDKQEGEEFEAQIREIDQFLLETALEKGEKDEWPIKSMFTLKPGRKLDLELIEQKYKWICRPSKKPQYPPYIGFKYETQRADEAAGIPEDKEVAHVVVWNNQNMDEPVAEKLTKDNIVPKKKEDRKGKTIYLDKGDYVKVIFWFQKMFFTQDAFGPTLVVDELVYDTEKNLRSTGSDGKRRCNFSAQKPVKKQKAEGSVTGTEGQVENAIVTNDETSQPAQ